MIQHPLVSDVRLDDLIHVANHMRQADRDEVDAASGQCPLGALRSGRLYSDECYTLRTTQGVPAAIFGVVPLPEGGGGVWLLGTDDIKRYALAFHRGMRPELEKMTRRWGFLTNAVDARNTVHIRWLRSLGFVFDKPIAYGRLDLPFIPFIKVPHV